MCDDTKREDKKNEEMRMIYQIFIDDIRHIKNQQWQVTYYGLLIQAAIVGFYEIFNEIEAKLVLSIISGFISLLGVVFLVIYQINMGRYRKKKREIRETFNKEVQKIFINKISIDCLFTVTFSIMQILAAILIIYYLNT